MEVVGTRLVESDSEVGHAKLAVLLSVVFLEAGIDDNSKSL